MTVVFADKSLSRPAFNPRYMESKLTQHIVQSRGLGSLYYIPNFVSKDEEQYLIRKVRAYRPSAGYGPETKLQIMDAPQTKWRNLSKRRFVSALVAAGHFNVNTPRLNSLQMYGRSLTCP